MFEILFIIALAAWLFFSAMELVLTLPFAPTLIASIYGMNFRLIPELDWAFGYPMALGLMLAMGLALYLTFRHNKWI